MRRRRTIYYNDARHYYLWVFEPPIHLRDAWRPIDEIAGTSIDTFSYGVERGDGLFYPSRVGLMFGADKHPFHMAYEWRAWQSMQSLIQRGLDPLQVLIDRAHDKGLDFFASLRMAGYGGMDQAHQTRPSASWNQNQRALLASTLRADFAHEEVRDHQFAVLEELATRYEVDGIELDFAFTCFYFNPDEAAKHISTMTKYVAEISRMVRQRPGGSIPVGVRILPTEEMCLRAGLDVRTWLQQGLVDFVVPLFYPVMVLDPDMPIDWIVQAAHEADASVYGMLQPYVRDEYTGSPQRWYADAEILRATAANFWARGVDGLYTWFMHWPLEDTERRMLTELGDPDLIEEGDKRYVLRLRNQAATELGYDANLPLEIKAADPERRHAIPFYIADDIAGAAARIRRVRLWISFSNLVSGDQLEIFLNGDALAGEVCLRDFSRGIGPASAYTLEFHLEKVRPTKGQNLLEIVLEKRPDELVGGVIVQEMEITVEYGPYPTGLACTRSIRA